MRWLCDDGHVCRAGEVVAYCNIGLARAGPRDAPTPFATETLDFQVTLATPLAGRLTRAPDSSRGGFFDTMGLFQLWTPDFAIGTIEPEADRARGEGDGELRLMMAAGRRTANIAEDRSGLLTGWHDRRRAWRVEDDRPIGTLLGLGICELSGVMRGERFGFLEMFEAIEGSAQVVHVPDSTLVPTARLLAEQLRRTPAEKGEIARDFAETLAGGPITPSSADWIFAGAVLSSLQASPLNDRYDILTRHGPRQAGPPDAVVLSLGAEIEPLLRHRRLGYTFHSHDFRVGHAGPAFFPWLRANFEPVPRSLDEIRADYRALFDLLRAERPNVQMLICNLMSTAGDEDIQTYAPFDAPLGRTLASVRNKELNLMLHDLARERDIAIVDSDAIAAELGGQRSLPDGVHQNGPMQAELRAEILRILRVRGVPGFSPARAPVS